MPWQSFIAWQQGAGCTCREPAVRQCRICWWRCWRYPVRSWRAQQPFRDVRLVLNPELRCAAQHHARWHLSFAGSVPAYGGGGAPLPASSLDRILCWSMMQNCPENILGIKHRTAGHLLVAVLSLPRLPAAWIAYTAGQ